MKTNKAKRYYVYFCESKNKGLSCIDYRERDIHDKTIDIQCVHADYCALGTICLLKQLNYKKV